MTLDESTDNDLAVEKNDLRFLVDRNLLARCGEITVDYIEDTHYTGFAIFPAYPLLGGC